MRTYSDLEKLKSYEERLNYLKLDSALPGDMTFGFLRDVNQRFYNSKLWKTVRAQIIGRDLGYDLGVPGYDIYGKVLVHHINPLSPGDILHSVESIIDPENLITVSHDTHLAIHFGSRIRREPTFVERYKGDTKLW